jgi:protein SCO1
MILVTLLVVAGLSFLVYYYAVGFESKAASTATASAVPVMPIKVPNPQGGRDSVIKTIGPFSFTSQTGAAITQDSLKGKIWVADVFFTTCQSICPKLSSGLQRIQNAFKGDPEVRLVSFSVDPDYDSIPVLQTYAAQYGALDHQWYLLTGDKATLYKVEHEDYFFSAMEDEDKTIKFVHDNTLRLVDKEGRFRGRFYDGTDPADVDAVIADIQKLKDEYAQNK